MKQMIWSSYDLLDETAKEEYQNSQREILDDDSYEVSDEEWAEEVYCHESGYCEIVLDLFHCDCFLKLINQFYGA